MSEKHSFFSDRNPGRDLRRIKVASLLGPLRSDPRCEKIVASLAPKERH